jgi:hypothetical protein
MIAVITPGLTTVTPRTVISPARVWPFEFPTLASGGEITTVAPGRKFVPTSVILIRSAPRVENPGETLVRTGPGKAAAVKFIGLEVDPPPRVANGLKWALARVLLSHCHIRLFQHPLKLTRARTGIVLRPLVFSDETLTAITKRM